MLFVNKAAPELSSVDWNALEQILSRFEDERKRGLQPPLEDYLPAQEHLRQRALCELVFTDLEYRLKDGEPARVEQYLNRFPELKSDPASELELIRAELLDRARREPDLALSEFLERFPQHDASLRAAWQWMNLSGQTLSRHCPCCHERLELPEPGSPDASACRACGSAVRVESETRSCELSPDSKLGKYALLGELGRGNFGIVYRARDTELDRIVALKVLRTVHHQSRGSLHRFLREARAAAQLEHPHIVPIYDFDREGETRYLVYAFVAGTTLARRLGESRLPFDRTAAVVGRIAAALHYAHGRGVIHRDVKPANILLDALGQPHLTDFGLAKRDSGELTMTFDGDPLGTPAYMSPEQARGEAHRVDGRSDLFSLGVVLYQMITATVPFQGDNWPAVLKQLLYDEPQPPRRIDAAIPRDLETICLKCLEKEPARRYASAQALAHDLERFSKREPILARPVGRAERVARWCRRRPAVAGLSLALALLAVSAIALNGAQRARARVSDAVARVSERKAERLLGSSTRSLERKLEQAGNTHESLAFMPKSFHDHILKDIGDLNAIFEAESPESNPELRLRALKILGWGYSLTQNRAQGCSALADAIKLGGELRSSTAHDQNVVSELASCHDLLANLLHYSGSTGEAEPHYRDAIRLCRELVNDDRKLPALGEYLIDQANNFRDQNRPVEAAKAYSEALAIFKDLLTKDAPNPDYIRGEAIAFANLGQLVVPKNLSKTLSTEDRIKTELARSHIKSAIDLFDRLHADPASMPGRALEQALCYQGLAKFERRLRNFEAAVSTARRAVDQLKSVAKHHPGVAECHYRLAEALENLGTTNGHARRWNDAFLAYKEAEVELAEVSRISPNDPRCESLLSRIQQNVAVTKRRMLAQASKASESGH
jgi:serine/threonine protein kinase